MSKPTIDSDFLYYGTTQKTPRDKETAGDFRCTQGDTPTIEYIKSSRDNKKLVKIHDIVLKKAIATNHTSNRVAAGQCKCIHTTIST
uniref:Uncharacterized protein n=1 Tax=Arundo donax TaxID=35708 RepID=A0A0A9CP98_ARUDO